jgi:hypothetical protein
LKIDLTLKGFVSHTHKNRTNVKVDYSYLNVTADEVPDSAGLHQFLVEVVEGEMLPEEVLTNPLYIVATKSRKMHLCLRYKSFRQMNKYYEEMAKELGTSTHNSDKGDFKYMAPGLFREKAEAFAFMQDHLAASADVTHQGEDIFLRLIKVYFKAAKKTLDM